MSESSPFACMDETGYIQSRSPFPLHIRSPSVNESAASKDVHYFFTIVHGKLSIGLGAKVRPPHPKVLPLLYQIISLPCNAAPLTQAGFSLDTS